MNSNIGTDRYDTVTFLHHPMLIPKQVITPHLTNCMCSHCSSIYASCSFPLFTNECYYSTLIFSFAKAKHAEASDNCGWLLGCHKRSSINNKIYLGSNICKMLKSHVKSSSIAVFMVWAPIRHCCTAEMLRWCLYPTGWRYLQKLLVNSCHDLLPRNSAARSSRVRFTEAVAIIKIVLFMTCIKL